MSNNNSVSDLCELGVRAVRDESGVEDFHCVAELRLASAELLIGDDDCEVSISRATIVVDLEGLEPKPGSRLGEPKRKNAVEINKTLKKEVSTATSFRGKTGVELTTCSFDARVGAGAAFDTASKTDATVEANEVIEHLRVKAVPNLRWEVSEYDGTALTDTYLTEDTLVTVNKSDRSNRCSVTTSVTVKQRHLEIQSIEQKSFFNRRGNNKQRLLDIFVAKSLSAAISAGGGYRGEIKLSETNVEVRSED